MPIINEYYCANAGAAMLPETPCCFDGPYQANRVPAIVNMGGNAVSGFSIRYSNLHELAAQDTIAEYMELGEYLRDYGFSGGHNRFYPQRT